MKWRQFLAYAGERALKTAAQTAIATIGVQATGLLQIDWLSLASIVGLAVIMSLLTSVVAWTTPPAALTAAAAQTPTVTPSTAALTQGGVPSPADPRQPAAGTAPPQAAP